MAAIAMLVTVSGCSGEQVHRASAQPTAPHRRPAVVPTLPPSVMSLPSGSTLRPSPPTAPPPLMRFDSVNTSDAFVSPSGATVLFGARQQVAGQLHWHVIVRTVATSAFSRADISPGGRLANADATPMSMSADGRHVLFTTAASNFDPRRRFELYERDLNTHRTVLVSVTNSGAPFKLHTLGGPMSLSVNGRYVVFIAQDDRNNFQVWLRDVVARTTLLVTSGRDGKPGNGSTFFPDIDPSGGHVVFGSFATNLVANDTNDQPDVFLWTRSTRDIERLSVAQDGSQLADGSSQARFTTDGHYVVFSSDAQLTSDACVGANGGPVDSAGARNTYVMSFASRKVVHLPQSCTDPYEADVLLAGSDTGSTVALDAELEDNDYVNVRTPSRQRALSYRSEPTSITANGRFVGINHYFPADNPPGDRAAGAQIWDLTQAQPQPAWLVDTLP